MKKRPLRVFWTIGLLVVTGLFASTNFHRSAFWNPTRCTLFVNGTRRSGVQVWRHPSKRWFLFWLPGRITEPCLYRNDVSVEDRDIQVINGQFDRVGDWQWPRIDRFEGKSLGAKFMFDNVRPLNLQYKSGTLTFYSPDGSRIKVCDLEN